MDVVPTIPTFSMVSPQFNKTVSVSNRNEYPMVLTLGAWSDSHFTWSTSSPVTIPPLTTTPLTVAHTGTATAATATVAYAITSGKSGSVVASADWDPGT